MVCPAGAAEEHAVDGVQSRRVVTEADALASCTVLAEAFQMPLDSTRRVLPLASMVLPGLEVFVAECDGRVESSVTVTRHGDVAGIWGMGTRPEAQGRRIGKALLSRVMVEHRDRGATAFFLGATPAGRPLYERLGYREIAAAQVWVRGETSQS
jgi:GNAT superfamily N-acetyltransferase